MARHSSILSISDKVKHGQVVFAENCAACHSSKIPPIPANSGINDGICAGGGNGPDYRACWDRYWEWTQTEDFKDAMVEMVTARDADGNDTFLEGNYLSSERRVPVDLMQTNACTRARHQWSGRRHLGQFHLVVLQEPAAGQGTHGQPSGLRRRDVAAAAGQRARLSSPAVADQSVVDRAVPVEQLGRP